jgi:hypothetical protein
MRRVVVIRCWQCGTTKRLEIADAGRQGEVRQFCHAVDSAGWWRAASGSEFCPSCRRSAKLAIGLEIDAGAAG